MFVHTDFGSCGDKRKGSLQNDPRILKKLAITGFLQLIQAVLCEVRAEAEEIIDDRNVSMIDCKHPPPHFYVWYLRNSDCKFVARREKILGMCVSLYNSSAFAW